MVDRNYVLDIIKSKDVTIGEFNYDKMTCPPIKLFFGDYDLQRLYELATSLRYSARPQVKYQEIDLIMKSRGFSKLSAGTNRVVYKCIDDDSFVAKVAVDAVGISDNPREYMNQFDLKPFCAKTFEVSPNGVIAFSERLNPITNREQFLSIAEDIFTLLSEFIIDGTRVLDDCGTKFFMNYGLRNGWGPCLLDYTYLYKLDGNKLFCNRPDKTSEIGICGGELDYDGGYNNIVCKKCGAIYRAKDLELKIKENKIIIKSLEGEFGKMKVSIKGGSKDYDVSTEVKKIEVNEPVNDTEDKLVYTDKKRTISVSLGHKDDNIIITNNKIEKKETETPDPVVEDHKEDNTKKKKSSKKTVEDKKDLNSPLKVGDEVKDAKDIIRDAFLEVGKLISENNIKKKIDNDYIDAIITGIKFILDTARVADGWNTDFERKLFELVINGKNINMENDIIIENNSILSIVKFLATVADTSDEISRVYTEEPLNENVVAEDSSTSTNNIEEAAKEIEYTDTNSEDNNELEEDVYYEEDDEVGVYDDDYEPIQMTGYVTFAAKLVDIKTKLTNEESKNVLLIEDGNGGFLTVGDGDKYLAVDNIDNFDVNDINFISKQFFDKIMKEVDSKTTELKEDTFTPEDENQVKTVNGVQIKEK